MRLVSWTKSEKIYPNEFKLTPVGTWWELNLSKKIIRYLRYVPLAYLRACCTVIPTWRANRNNVRSFLTLKEAYCLLVITYSRKLDCFYRYEGEQ